MAKPQKQAVPVIGWREWVALPDLHVPAIKAKVDTGARSSALHAYEVKEFLREGKTWVRFIIHPIQHDLTTTIPAEAELLEYRRIRSSTGHDSVRPVILTTARLLGLEWKFELTLIRRDQMGFRMLLGRQAVRRRFLIDCGRSFLGGEPEGKKRWKKS